MTIDILRTSHLVRACEGMDWVCSCVGASVIPVVAEGRGSFSAVDTPANLRLIRASEKAGVQGFLYISVFTGGRPLRSDFVRGHERVVETLRDSALDHIVVRPTGLFSSLVRIMREPSWGLIPEHGGGEARTNPIHQADLAAYCADALEAPQERLELDIGGPEVLARRQIAELVLGRGHSRRAGVRVPAWALRAAGAAIRPIYPRVGHLLPFIADVLAHDFVAPPYGYRTLAAYVNELRDRSASSASSPADQSKTPPAIVSKPVDRCV